MFGIKIELRRKLNLIGVLIATIAVNSSHASTAADVRADSKLYVSISQQKSPTGEFVTRVASPELVLERGHENGVFEKIDNVPQQNDIWLQADRIVVRDPIRTLGANLHINARELVFENAAAMFDTTPYAPPIGPTDVGKDGENGRNAGNIFLHVAEVKGEKALRFRLNGDPGGAPGPGGQHLKSTDGVLETKFPCKKFNRYTCINKTGFRSDNVFPNVIKKGFDWPEDGKNGIPAGVAGSGGNGGKLVTTVIPDQFTVETLGGAPGTFDGKTYPGGESGNPVFSLKLKWKRKFVSPNFQVVYEATTEEAHYASNGVPAAQTQRGNPGVSGSIESISAEWYSPRITAVTYPYIDDLYYIGNSERALLESRKHLSYIERAQEHLSPIEQGEVAGLQSKLNHTAIQIYLMKDYYGHALAWVPPLSLESQMNLYKEETKQAVKRLYLSKRLLAQNGSQKEKWQNVLNQQADLREQIIEESKNHANVLSELPSKKLQLEELELRSRNVQLLSESMTVDLNELAKKNVDYRHKIAWLKKGLKIVGGIAMTFPVGQPFTGLAGAAVVGAVSFDTKDPLNSVAGIATNVSKVIGASEAEMDKPKPELSKETQDRIADGFGAVLSLDVQRLPSVVKSWHDDFMRAYAAAKTEQARRTVREKFLLKIKDVKSEAAFANNALNEIIAGLASKEVPGAEAMSQQAEVKAEFEKLAAGNPRFQELLAESERLAGDKKAFVDEVNSMLKTLSESSSNVVSKMTQIAELSAGYDGETLTPNAESIVREIQTNAERSLRKYHYYLQRAYAYRFLKKYPGQPDLRTLFERIEKLVATPGQPLAREDYDDLHALYHAEVSTILEEVVDGIEKSKAERIATRPVSLTADELARLSSGSIGFELLGRACLGNLPNSVPAPCIENDAEDVRIVNVEVADFQLAEDSVVPPHFNVEIEHSGVSKFWLDGRMHLFRLYDGISPRKKSWRNTLLDSGKVELQNTSDTEKSILRAFFQDTKEFEDFVRPSAWGDMTIRVNSDTEVQPKLGQLKLLVSFTYRDAGAGTLTWRQHIAAQNEQLLQIYRKTLGREPSALELASKRTLLDLGYSSKRIAQMVSELNAPAWTAQPPVQIATE